MIKQILDNLPKESLRKLTYAHEHGFSQRVDVGKGKFVGVNVEVKNIRVIERVGAWTYGEKK